jgi:hypothetical protein
MDFQDAIRARIEERQEELGLPATGGPYKSVGLGSTTVRNFLIRLTRSMTVETAEKLAPLLKVSAQWLLYGETAEIVELWDRVPLEHRPLAKAVLERFVQQNE